MHSLSNVHGLRHWHNFMHDSLSHRDYTLRRPDHRRTESWRWHRLNAGSDEPTQRLLIPVAGRVAEPEVWEAYLQLLE